jgi:hypothetical protein
MNITEMTIAQDGATVTAYEAGGAFYAKAVSGRRTKPDFHYRFKTVEKRQEYINKYLSDRAASVAYKAQRAADKKAEKQALNAVEQFPVGTIVYSSWGWEQTNLDFYQVVGHFGRVGLEVVAIGMTQAGAHSGMSADYMPDASKQGKETYKARQVRPDSLSSSGSDYALYRWDGKPKYCSWYA